MARASKTFRVFVSSTFSDLKAERDVLQEKVFPRLRELCAAHGARFQAIDLRWGISREASRDQQTMNICLSEIARCQEVTPRPNFVVLLGERYGWCPPPSQIPAEEFKRILAVLGPGEKRLLLWEEDGRELGDGVEMVHWDSDDKAYVGDKGWYRRDDNAVPGEVVLQPWDDYNYEEWAEIEARLHQILERAAERVNLEEDARFKYWASATHQEIAAGALQVDDADEHVFCFFREIKGLPKDSRAEDFRDLDDAGKPEEAARDRLHSLKKQLKDRLGDNVKHCRTTWTGDGPSGDRIDELCEDVYQALKGIIEKQLEELEEIDPLEAEVAEHEAFGEERARFFTGRAAYLQEIAKYLKNASPHPLAIWGEPGSGKSALLARAVQRAQEAYGEGAVVYRFIGATPESSSGRALLESLCRQISRRHGADESDIPMEYNDLVLAFPERLALATAEEPLIVFIDALDQLSDADNARALTWLPGELPEHVRLAVSTLPGDCRRALETKLPQERLVELTPMPTEEAEDLLNLWLGDAERTLQPAQRAYVLNKFAQCPKPLYLKLAFEEARRWRSHDGLSTGADEMPGLSDDIPGIIRDLFARLLDEVNHGETLVARSLGYLAAARNGLTEGELLDVLARDVDVYAWFLRTLFHTPPDLLRRGQVHLEEERGEAVSEEAAEAWLGELRQEENEEQLHRFLSAVLAGGEGLRLPVVLWSRLYHDLEPYLTERAADGTSLLAFYHPATFGQAVREHYLCEDMREARHRALAAYFQGQPLYRATQGAEKANLRKLSELPYQEAHAGKWRALQATLTDYAYMQAKVSGLGPQPLIEDYGLLELQATGQTGCLPTPNQQALKLICEALALSRHVLRDHPLQLAGHLLARLLDAQDCTIAALLSQASAGAPGPWLRPIAASLARPGGALIHTLWGHAASVKAVAATPHGHRAVSASHDGTLRVWDTFTGEQLLALRAHSKLLNKVMLVCDGKVGISAYASFLPSGRYPDIDVWDLSTGQVLQTFQVPESCAALDAAKNGRFIVAAGRGSDQVPVHVWDALDGREIHLLKGHPYPVREVAVSPDGRNALTHDKNDVLRVWDLRTGSAVRTLEGCRRVLCNWCTPDGAWLVAAVTEAGLDVRNLSTGQLVQRMRSLDSVRTSAVTEDGRTLLLLGHYEICVHLASTPYRKRKTLKQTVISAVEVTSGRELWRKEFEPGGLTMCPPIAIAGGGQYGLCSAVGGALCVFDMKDGRRIAVLQGHVDRITDISIEGNGFGTVSASDDGTLKVWDVAAVEKSRIRPGHKRAITALALSPDGTWAVSGSLDRTLRVWDLATGQSLFTLEGHTNPVSGVAVTPDGKRIVSVSGHRFRGRFGEVASGAVSSGNSDSHESSCCIMLWNAENGKRLRVHRSFPLNAVAVMGDGQHILLGSQNVGSGLLKDVNRGNLSAVCPGCEPVRAVAVTGDDRIAVFAGGSKAYVCDLDVKQVRFSLSGDNDDIISLAVSADGTHCVTGSQDAKLQVWDLEAGRLLRDLPGHTASINAVKVTNDGKRIVSASSDHTLRIWDLDSGGVIAAFWADDPLFACDVGPEGETYLAAGGSGRLHILRLDEGHPPDAVRLRRSESTS